MTWSTLLLLAAGAALLWLLSTLWGWRRAAIEAQFTAEREMASWRFRRTLWALVLLLPLLAVALRDLLPQ